LLSFERRRSRLEAELRHPITRPRLPRKRYEDLRVVAALGRAETRCLDGSGHAPSGVHDCLTAGLALQLVPVQGSLDRMERWLSPESRRRAETQAERRLQAIADEVQAELVAEGLTAPGPVPATESPTVETPGAVDAKRCTATTRKGVRCKNRVRTPGVCAVHARAANVPVPAASPDALPQGEDAPAGVLPIPVGRVLALSDAVLSERVKAPNLAAIRDRLHSRVHVWRPGARIRAGTTFGLASTAAMAVAAALIWSGLSGDGPGASPGELDVGSPAELPGSPVSQANPGGGALPGDDATALVSRLSPREQQGNRGPSSTGASRGAAAPSSRKPATGPGKPGSVPSGSGSAGAPAPAPGPDPGSGGTPEPQEPAPPPAAPSPPPASPAPPPASPSPPPASPSPPPEPRPTPSLADTAAGLISDLTKTADDAVKRLPLLGGP
jgi:hypothetical protein